MKLVLKKTFLIILAAAGIAVSGGVLKPFDEMPGEFYQYYNNSTEKTANDTDISEYPETFDLRDYGIVSPVRDQGDYGTCWAISALGSIETQLMRDGFDKNAFLSPWHLVYFTFTGENSFQTGIDSPFEVGATHTQAMASLSKWQGPADEKTFPYDSGDTADESLRYNHEYCLHDVNNTHEYLHYYEPADESRVKEFLYSKNAVSAFYGKSDEYYNDKTASYYCDEEWTPSHAILIVGWDDNYSRTNFNTTPSRDGAWLIKNSYGTDYGDEGYIWISYDDVTLCDTAVYNVVDSSNYENVYSYDNHGWTASVSTDKLQASVTGYMANIFTADEDEKISAVSFYTTEDNAEYEVEVYNRISGNNNPKNGELISRESGKEKYSGYHTIDLKKTVPVSKNGKFSVVIKVTNKTSPYTIPVEADVRFHKDGYIYEMESGKTKDHRSFISNNGTAWRDVNGLKYKYFYQRYQEYLGLIPDRDKIKNVTIGSVCIKAFTENEK